MTNAAEEGRERTAAVDGPMESFDESDTSVTRDPFEDPAQAEWEGDDQLDPDAVTGTGADPAEIPDEADQVPAQDLPTDEVQPESQGEDLNDIDLGPDGQGDIQPEDM